MPPVSTPLPPPMPAIQAVQTCPAAQASRLWVVPAGVTSASVDMASAAGGSSNDYRHQLRPTPAGWPLRSPWCVWVEPVQTSGPQAIWDERWWRAVTGALRTWQQELPIVQVQDPDQAQVLVQRRRPPIQNRRASHGRALLQLLEVQREGRWQLEPRVDVLISPGQAEPAMQATALHELGHAFGLWGHSDQAGDTMAVHAGATPVLQLSQRDRATLQWLLRQPGLRQDLLTLPAAPGSRGPQPASPAR